MHPYSIIRSSSGVGGCSYTLRTGRKSITLIPEGNLDWTGGNRSPRGGKERIVYRHCTIEIIQRNYRFWWRVNQSRCKLLAVGGNPRRHGPVSMCMCVNSWYYWVTDVCILCLMMEELLQRKGLNIIGWCGSFISLNVWGIDVNISRCYGAKYAPISHSFWSICLNLPWTWTGDLWGCLEVHAAGALSVQGDGASHPMNAHLCGLVEHG